MKTFPYVASDAVFRSGTRLFTLCLCHRAEGGVRSIANITLDGSGAVLNSAMTERLAPRYPAFERLARRWLARSVPQHVEG